MHDDEMDAVGPRVRLLVLEPCRERFRPRQIGVPAIARKPQIAPSLEIVGGITGKASSKDERSDAHDPPELGKVNTITDCISVLANVLCWRSEEGAN